jgi:hypothetical protein
MPLVEIELDLSAEPIPENITRLIIDAQRQIDALDEQRPAAIPAFVPSDFGIVYRALVAIDGASLAAGRRFIEWGSGIGVITCLAELVGFDAVGIEIEKRLVEVAESLAEEHGIAVQFACGSFVPPGAEPSLDASSDVHWLTTDGPDGYDELQLEPDDFDTVFAYPWPGEEQVIFDLFAEYAATGALLLTYHGQDGLRLQRKVRG